MHSGEDISGTQICIRVPRVKVNLMVYRIKTVALSAVFYKIDKYYSTTLVLITEPHVASTLQCTHSLTMTSKVLT